jgi:ABC-type transporter Mla MlaB component
MGATLKESGEGKMVVLDGELTLPHAEGLKAAFLKALGESDDVSIAFENIQDVDLSLLQLFCSLHRSALQQKKRVKLEGAAPRALREAVEAAGFSRHRGCKLDCDQSCLWVAVTGAHGG